MTDNIQEGILVFIENNNDEVQGTQQLTLALSTLNCKSYILRSARMLQVDGRITIIPSHGGRGKKTIYKRNRNQPGIARKPR